LLNVFISVLQTKYVCIQGDEPKKLHRFHSVCQYRQSYYNKRGFFGPPRMRSVVTYVIGLRGTCTCTSTPYSL